TLLKTTLAAAALSAAFASTASANDATGAGASLVYPAISRWSADYQQATGKQINYQSIGSGGGIAQIKAATVDFGSSDKPLAPDGLANSGLAQLPSVICGVVPIISLQGVQAGAMRLDGATLAGIFLGKVTTWNDPGIVALNGGIPVPDA